MDFKNCLKNINNRELIVKLKKLIESSKGRGKKNACMAVFLVALFSGAKAGAIESDNNITIDNDKIIECIKDGLTSDIKDLETVIEDNRVVEVQSIWDLEYDSFYEMNNNVTRSIDLTSTLINATIEAMPVTYERKIKNILEYFGLSRDEFNVVVATIIGEAAADSYVDAYNVANVIYNRTISNRWNANVSNGGSLFGQVTRPGQFSVYLKNTYKKYLGYGEGSLSWCGAVDFFYEASIGEIISPNYYLQFRASNFNKGTQLVPRGNKYFDVMNADDKIVRSRTLC